VLKEEVRIRRVRSTERHQEKVQLRYQEAVVTRQKDDADKVAGGEGTKSEGP
jgi:stress response protein YsnF